MLFGWRRCSLVVALLGQFLLTAANGADLEISVDFEGGSGKVVSLDQQRRAISIVPTQHVGRGWLCWWYFRVDGVTPGEQITLTVGPSPWATPDQAAVSTDNENWTRTAPGVRDGKEITYRHQVDAKTVWFAWGPRFVPSDAARLVAWAAKQSPHASEFELCRTRADRPVPALRIKQPGVEDKNRRGIWVNARQHAWEAGSSWVCRGFVEWIVSDDPRAEALRKKSLITIVPIMDIDSVYDGAGGKNQTPNDHNRDWGDSPHWRSVQAAIESIKAQDEAGNFDLFIDLHNPGAGAKNPFYFITPRSMLPEIASTNLDRFLASSRLEMTGPLKFVGTTQESGSNYDPQWKKISKNWVTFNTADRVVAVTLETAWNAPGSTTEGYRQLGGQLGRAVELYFREPAKESE